MAKKGTIPTVSAPVLGVPHYATKQATAPKQRQNLTLVRTGPVKRMGIPVKALKGDKPSNFGNF